MPITNGIYYSEHLGGENDRPVVLLHGAGSSHLCWPPLMRRLAGWSILALDLPGHGKSSLPSCGSIASYAKQVVDLLADKHAHQVVLVGHSMGGAVALQIALEYPNLAFGLGLISTGAHWEIPPGLLESFQYPYALEQALQTFERLAFSPHTLPVERKRMLRPLRQVPPAVLEDDWRACAAFDIRTDMTRRDLPAWVAVGADDRLTPLPDAHFLAAYLPRARLQIVPRAGHFLPLEQPAALSQGFSDFLASLSPTEKIQASSSTVTCSRLR